uniref:NGFI-A-binding protein 1-like n=1 Tax=Myxine glutinosa TaxID=7769 RepID=UPI00358DE6CD
MEVPQPRTLGELQLFRLLERGNLLSYYSTFVEQGGDDVQQLVDAGEDEFLEIMALVGMASKPLHVRRLQKALQEWVNNPTVFLQPASSLPSASIPISRLAGLAATASALPGRTAALAQVRAALPAILPISPCPVISTSPPTGGISVVPLVRAVANAVEANSRLRPGVVASVVTPEAEPSRHSPVPPAYTAGYTSASGSPNRLENGSGSGDTTLERDLPPSPNDSHGGFNDCSSSGELKENTRQAITLSAAHTLQTIPSTDPRELQEVLASNRKLTAMLGHIFALAPEDPMRHDEIRKFSAIYGRFDSRRKEGRRLTQHELSVNEAAFQLCLQDPALLTRRDELFPLARQVVRDSGYRYSHRQSRARGSDSLSPKRMKLDGDNSQDAHSPPQLELEGGKADGRCSEGSVSGEAPSRDGGSECSSGEDGHDDDEGQASGSSRPHSPPSPSNTESGGLGGLAGLCEGLGLALRARCQGESNHTNHNIKVEAAWADSEATVADCGFQTCPVKIEPASPE